ncbi:uncharacterized protein ACB058_003354 isoform 2-T4 [Synchiropus picturatus]
MKAEEVQRSSTCAACPDSRRTKDEIGRKKLPGAMCQNHGGPANNLTVLVGIVCSVGRSWPPASSAPTLGWSRFSRLPVAGPA